MRHDYNTICRECAEGYEAMWPEGHVATFWTGWCGSCGKETSVCDVSDWNWPKGKGPRSFDISRRD